MSRNHRDLVVTLQPYERQYQPLGEVEFVYLKEATLPVDVTVDDQTTGMAEGDTRRFDHAIGKMEVYNNNDTIQRVVFVVGVGEFQRFHIYAGINGNFSAGEGLQTLSGLRVADSRSKTRVSFTVNNRNEVDVNAGTILQTDSSGNTSYYMGASNGAELRVFMGNGSNYEKHDLFSLNQIGTSNFNTTYKVGDPGQTVPTVGAVFANGRYYRAGHSTGEGVRFHSLHGSEWRYAFTLNYTADFPSTSNSGAVSFDRWRKQLLVGTTNGRVRVYDFTGTIPTFNKVVQFPFAGIPHATHLIDGRWLVNDLAGSGVHIYDSNLVELFEVTNLNGYNMSFVRAANLSVVTVAIGGTTLREVSLIDYSSPGQLLLTGGMAQQSCGNSIAIDASVVFAENEPILYGESLKAVVQVFLGTAAIPSDYLDYIYAVKYNNGVSDVDFDTGVQSFAAAEIADNFTIDARHPVIITARSGLFDQGYTDPL